MRAWLLGTVLGISAAALGSDGVRVESCHARGWLTGAGLAIAGGAVIALSSAAQQGALSESAGRVVASYYANGAAPTVREASAVRWMQERSDGAASRALALAISGAVGLAVGVGLVLFDGWRGSASMTVAIQTSGASVVLSGRF